MDKSCQTSIIKLRRVHSFKGQQVRLTRKGDCLPVTSQSIVSLRKRICLFRSTSCKDFVLFACCQCISCPHTSFVTTEFQGPFSATQPLCISGCHACFAHWPLHTQAHIVVVTVSRDMRRVQRLSTTAGFKQVSIQNRFCGLRHCPLSTRGTLEDAIRITAN